MPASSPRTVPASPRRFGARILIAVPPQGLGQQLTDMQIWLDTNCGFGNWAMTPAGLRGIVNDAMAISFVDPACANAFVRRWCIGYRAETVQGGLRRRRDAPVR